PRSAFSVQRSESRSLFTFYTRPGGRRTGNENRRVKERGTRNDDVFTSASSCRVLDGQIVPVAPLFPGAGVVADAREVDQPQRDVCVRRAVAALAIRKDLGVGRHAGLGVHRLQLAVGLVAAVRGEVLLPFDVDGARNRAAALGAHDVAEVLAVAAGVDNRDV